MAAAAPPSPPTPSLAVDTYHFQHIVTTDQGVYPWVSDVNPYTTYNTYDTKDMSGSKMGEIHMVSESTTSSHLPFVKITNQSPVSNQTCRVSWQSTWGETFNDFFNNVVPTIVKHNSLKSNHSENSASVIQRKGTMDGFMIERGELSCHLKDALRSVYPMVTHDIYDETQAFGVNMRIPSTDKLICIGDIHGGLFGLVQLLYRMSEMGVLNLSNGKVNDGYVVVCLGDVMDRGNASVVCWLLLSLLVLCQGRQLHGQPNNKFILLRGNHEGGMFDNHSLLYFWKDNRNNAKVGLFFQLMNRLDTDEKELEKELFEFYQMVLCFPICARIQFVKDNVVVKSVMLQHGCAPELPQLATLLVNHTRLYHAQPFTIPFGPSRQLPGYRVLWSDVHHFNVNDADGQNTGRTCVYHRHIPNIAQKNQVDLIVRGHTDSEYTAYVNVEPDLLYKLPIYLLYDRTHEAVGRAVDQLPLGFLYYHNEMKFKTVANDQRFKNTESTPVDDEEYNEYYRTKSRLGMYNEITWATMQHYRYGVLDVQPTINYDGIWNEWKSELKSGNRVLFPVIPNVLWRASHQKSQGLVSRLVPDTAQSRQWGIQPVVTTSSNTGHARDLGGTAFLCIHVNDTIEQGFMDTHFKDLQTNVQTHKQKLRMQLKVVLDQYPNEISKLKA